MCHPHLAVSYSHARERECHIAGDHERWPWLIEAKVPKAAILGVVIIQTARQAELIVDYEKIPAGAFKALGELQTPEAVAERIERTRDAAKEPLAA